MAIPTVALNEATPAGTSYVRDGDDRIKEYKKQVREILEVDHYFPSSGQNAACGRHKQMTLIEAADIGTGADGVPILGAQLSGVIPELTYTGEDNVDVQITKDGKLNALALGGVYPATLATMITMLAFIYPIGCIYTTIVATNPATVFGFGTWVAFGDGRVLVGNGTSDAAYAAGATGGESTHTLITAEMPAHTHPIKFGTGAAYADGGPRYTSGTSETVTSESTGGGGAHNNLQPYIVVYFWKRTA